jgi:hypothetical protein
MHDIPYFLKTIFCCTVLTICIAKIFHMTEVQYAGLTFLGKTMVLLGPLRWPSCPAFSPQVSTARWPQITVWKREAHIPRTESPAACTERGVNWRGSKTLAGGGECPSWWCEFRPHDHTWNQYCPYCGLLGQDCIQSSGKVQTNTSNLTRSLHLLPQRWWKVPPQHLYLPTNLHGITSQQISLKFHHDDQQKYQNYLITDI